MITKIKLDLKLISGLHIGNQSGYTVPRGIDSETLKDGLTEKQPVFPLSSFKGKLRSSAEMLFGLEQNKNFKEEENLKRHECDTIEKAKSCPVCSLFGSGNTKENHFQGALVFKKLEALEDSEITEIKIENSVERCSGNANPRVIERTANGIPFKLEVLLVCEEGEKAKLLQNFKAILFFAESQNFGGNKSRGYGQIKFEKLFFGQELVLEGESENV